MSASPRPKSGGSQWGLRVVGVVLILGALLLLADRGLKLWNLAQSEQGILGGDGMPLAYGIGALFGGALMIMGAVWLFQKSASKPEAKESEGAASAEPVAVAEPVAKAKKRASKRWTACNVLQAGGEQHQVWHFDPRGRKYVAKGTATFPATQPVPARIAGKSWQDLVQPKLNVAWLPPESVFLRVVQLPQCAPAEVIPMVELQLEKLSPLPVTQIIWTVHIVGDGVESGMQTVLVIMVERDAAEEFLGQLEERGFYADRLDLPVVDQLLATPIHGDGAWIYPEAIGGLNQALVAWWYGGVLRSLTLVEMPAEGNRGAALREQLLQMAWSGEVEGWLNGAPKWALVADAEAGQPWLVALREGLAEPVEQVEPQPMPELALASATRAAKTDFAPEGLLPLEYATRYRQQFTDRLWMRGLGTVLVLYLVGVGIYFGWLSVEKWRTGTVVAQKDALADEYTNSIQLKAQLDVLTDLQELKYAALDCWKLTAELLPEGATLDNFSFKDGEELRLRGTAPEGSVNALIDFSAAMRQAKVRDTQMFDANKGEPLKTGTRAGRGGLVDWNFSLFLKRTEVH